MHARAVRRAAVVAAALAALVVPTAFADRVTASGDDLAPLGTGTYDAGTVATGGSATVAVSFRLACRNSSHVDAGQTLQLGVAGGTVPVGGRISGGHTTIGPIPDEWPADQISCFGSPTLDSTTPIAITLGAPSTPGTFDYVVSFTTALSPAGVGDGAAIPVPPSIVLRLAVVADLPPTLALPRDLVVEGNALGGAVVDYIATATDGEDDPDPVPSCAPATGDLFPVGTTTVSCSVADSIGQAVAGSFDVSVSDTTAPAFAGVPSSVELVTASAAGGPAAFSPPTARDVVAGDVAVICAPAPGDTVAVGATTVTCTASDPSGNGATTSFPLTMTYAPPVTLAARFDAPIGPTNVVGGAAGRTVPVKVTILRDGAIATGGPVDLVRSPCGVGPALGAPVPMSRQGDRWFVGLDTGGLAGCVTATVRLGGVAAGSFEMRFVGSLGSSSRR